MRFYLGRLVITPAVLTNLSVDEICYAIDSHVCGIWGDVSESVRKANETALINQGQLLSIYHTTCGTELRVLTTAGRLTTTVYLQGEMYTSGHQNGHRTD